MVVLAKDFYRVASPSTLADAPGRKWVSRGDDGDLTHAGYGFNHQTRHEVEMQGEALDVVPRWEKRSQSRRLDFPPRFTNINHSAPSTPHEEGGSDENVDMGEEGDWHDAEDDLEGPSPKAWRSTTVYATQDGALLGGRADFAFPQSSGQSFASGSTEGEEMQDAPRWHSESSESTDSKFLKGDPSEAAMQDANEKVRKWRGEHFPLPSDSQDVVGVGGPGVMGDTTQLNDNAAQLLRQKGNVEGANAESQHLMGNGSRVAVVEGGVAVSRGVSQKDEGQTLPSLERRREGVAPTDGYVERPVLVEEVGEEGAGETERKEAMKDGRKDGGGERELEQERRGAKIEKKGSWKKKASALFRSETIQRIRSHRQQEKAKTQHESVPEEGGASETIQRIRNHRQQEKAKAQHDSVPEEEGGPQDPAPPVILEVSADGEVELGPVEAVPMAEVSEAPMEKEAVATSLATDSKRVDSVEDGGVTMRVKSVKVHRMQYDEGKQQRVRDHATRTEEPLPAVVQGQGTKAAFAFDHRSRSVERIQRSEPVVEGIPRRAISRATTPEQGHHSSRRHHKSPQSFLYDSAPNGGDVRRSTGEADFRRARESRHGRTDSVDLQTIVRTQRAAWERERERWRSEIAGLRAQLEQLKGERRDGGTAQSKQNASEETGDGLAAPEQSDSPRIHSFSSPKSNAMDQMGDLDASADLPPRSEGLRTSGGSLHSQIDPLRQSMDGPASDQLHRSSDLPPLAASTDSSSHPRGGSCLHRSVSEQFSWRSAEKLRGLVEPLRRSCDGVESREQRAESRSVTTAEKAVQTGPVEGGEASYLAAENDRLRAEVARLQEETSSVVRQMEAKKCNSYGNAAFNGQKYDEAVLHYSAALDAKANDAEFNAVLYCNRATVQSALSRHMDALSDCLAALETDPRYTRAYMKKADVLAAVGDYEGALEDLSKLEPSDEVTSRVKDLRRRLRRAVAPMDYYAVLGVSANSSMADVKVSYRKLAMRFHPDRPNCTQGVIFQYIAQAYQVLSDSESRLRFDQLLEKGGGNSRK